MGPRRFSDGSQFLKKETLTSRIVDRSCRPLFPEGYAYETQVIKQMYVEGDAAGVAKGKSIFGAYMLYGSFVTLFINILNILGIVRQN